MGKSLSVAFFGASVSSTIGCLIIDLCIRAKFNLLSMIWLMSFVSSFVIFLLIVDNIWWWYFFLIGCSFFPVIGYRYYGVGCEDDLNYFWRLGFGVFLLMLSIVMVFLSKSFLEDFGRIFGDYGYVIFVIGLFVFGGTGLFVVLRNKDG